MRWTPDGRVADGYGIEGPEGVLLTLAMTTVRSLLHLSPAERRPAAMRVTSLVLAGLDAAEGRNEPLPVTATAAKLTPGVRAVLDALQGRDVVGWLELARTVCPRNRTRHAVELQVAAARRALVNGRIETVRGRGWRLVRTESAT